VEPFSRRHILPVNISLNNELGSDNAERKFHIQYKTCFSCFIGRQMVYRARFPAGGRGRSGDHCACLDCTSGPVFLRDVHQLWLWSCAPQRTRPQVVSRAPPGFRIRLSLRPPRLRPRASRIRRVRPRILLRLRSKILPRRRSCRNHPLRIQTYALRRSRRWQPLR